MNTINYENIKYFILTLLDKYAINYEYYPDKVDGNIEFNDSEYYHMADVFIEYFMNISESDADVVNSFIKYFREARFTIPDLKTYIKQFNIELISTEVLQMFNTGIEIGFSENSNTNFLKIKYLNYMHENINGTSLVLGENIDKSNIFVNINKSKFTINELFVKPICDLDYLKITSNINESNMMSDVFKKYINVLREYNSTNFVFNIKYINDIFTYISNPVNFFFIKNDGFYSKDLLTLLNISTENIDTNDVSINILKSYLRNNVTMDNFDILLGDFIIKINRIYNWCIDNIEVNSDFSYKYIYDNCISKSILMDNNDDVNINGFINTIFPKHKEFNTNNILSIAFDIFMLQAIYRNINSTYVNSIYQYVTNLISDIKLISKYVVDIRTNLYNTFNNIS